MRINSSIRGALGIILALSFQLIGVRAEDTLPITPRQSSHIPHLGVSGMAFQSGVSGQRHLVPLYFLGERADPAMSAFKGALGEKVLSRGMTSGVLRDTQRWLQVTPARNAAGNGIDHILVRTDAAGKFSEVMVVESKAFGSQLGMTRNGAQMSRQWIAAHLQESSNGFRQLSSRMSSSTVQPRHMPFSSAPGNALETVTGNNRRLAVWMDGNEIRYASSGGVLGKSDLKRALLRTANSLNNMAQGKVPYQAGVFRITTDAKGSNFVLSMRKLDPVTNRRLPGTQRILVAPFKTPKTPDEHLVYDSLKEELRKLFGNKKVVVEDVLTKATSDPTYLRRLTLKTNVPWREMAKRGAMGAGVGGVIAGALDLGMQYAFTGEIDLNQTARTAFTGAAAGLVGSIASSMTTHVIVTSEAAGNLLAAQFGITNSARIARILSGVSGGLGASAAFAYIPYLLGWSSLDAANKNFIIGSTIGVGAGLAGGGMIGLAAILGTAGTGTAISTLSGAAATSASLAWLGGGTVVAGGGGIATGAKVLLVSRVAGVVIIVGASIYAGYDALMSNSGRKAMTEKEIEWRKARVSSQFETVKF